MTELFAVFSILLLVALNGVFVAAEFAIIGVPRPAVERRAATGDQAAARILRVVRHPLRRDRYIATAQLGITSASLGLGMYGEHVMAGWIHAALAAGGLGGWAAAHTLASVLAVTLLTYVHIVLGEMVPKSLALQWAEETALVVSLPMHAVNLGLYPVVVALNGLGNGLLRLLGMRRPAGDTPQFYTPEELEMIVLESEQGGLLASESGRVVRELFEFGQLTAGEAMVPRINAIGIASGASAEELARTVRTAPHTRYPVFEGSLDRIVGMVHAKDVLALLRERAPLRQGDVRRVPFVPEGMPLDEVMEVMRVEQAEMVVVLDEFGGTAGVLTSEDLFEEVVGEITEERGDRLPIRPEADGTLHVVGTVRLDELGEALGRELEHEEVDTVSGLVLALRRGPARIGDTVEYSGLRFEVTAVAGRGVAECKVRRIAASRD